MKIKVIKPSFEILSPTAGLLQLIELAGRTCYKSEDKITDQSSSKFIRKLVKNGHESVLEHASITVKIICDRSCSHQLVRHRIGAYSQESQRFVKYKDKEFKVICPPDIGVPEGEYEYNYWTSQDNFDDLYPLQHAWLTNIAKSFTTYCYLIYQHIRPEDARSVLPNATKTEIVVTYNLRQWRHVFKERALNKSAQWQIRSIMLALLNEFSILLPEVFEDLYD